MNDNIRNVLVVGNNPEDLMSKYDLSITVSPYIIYKYNDASKLQKAYISFYEGILKDKKYTSNKQNDLLAKKLDFIKSKDPVDFFYYMTQDYEYDPQTGDAISNINPIGKWHNYVIGNKHSIPFNLFDGTLSFSSEKNNIDWSKTHLSNKEVYENTWDIILNNKPITSEKDQLIYDNMKNMSSYILSFNDKENYVLQNTSFWTYAYLDKYNGWVEMDETVNQFDWIKNFYDRFIKPLALNEKLTIFEYF